MLANPAVQPRPLLLTRRPTVVTETLPVDGVTFAVRPVAPWARGHLAFRGTRIFTALTLGWAGLIVLAFGAFGVPAAHDLGRSDVDPGLMAVLGNLAAWLVAFGIVHLVAAVGILRDRAWGLKVATWLLAIGVLVVVAGLVFAFAGRDPFALADPAPSPAASGLGLLAWTLGLYALLGWGLRRILVARQLV